MIVKWQSAGIAFHLDTLVCENAAAHWYLISVLAIIMDFSFSVGHS